MDHLRGILFWLGFFLLTFVFMLLLLIALPLPFGLRYRISRLWADLTLWWLKLCHGIQHRVDGLENLPSDPFIIMAKHQSTWETIALQSFFPPLVWVLKRELLWMPIFGWGLFTMQPIAINRSKRHAAMEQLLEQGRSRLAEGLNVVIFPEGTRTPWGQKGRYRLGGARLAEATGAPIVPVAHNAGYFWPRHQFRKRPGTISVVIGPWIKTEGRTAEDILNEVESWIEGQMQKLDPTAT